MRMVVTSESAMVYGKAMKRGEEFECPDKESRLWEALARAAHAGGQSSDGKLALVGEKANDQAEVQPRRRGSYSRRDMRAED